MRFFAASASTLYRVWERVQADFGLEVRMVDWEIKARGLADDLRTVAAVLGFVTVVGAWRARDGWELFGWLLIGWVALSGYASADARIKP